MKNSTNPTNPLIRNLLLDIVSKNTILKHLNFKRPPLVPVIAITTLFCISLLELWSLANGEFSQRCIQQVFHMAFASCVFFVVSVMPLKFWKQYAYRIYVASILLLVATVLFGKTIMGAKRWISIGFLTIQPSEIVRISLIIALAKYLSNITLPDIRRTRYLIGSAILLLIPVTLVLMQPDLGTTMLSIFVYIAMLFIVGVQLWKLVLLPISAIVMIPFIWSLLHDYQKNRVLMFFNPENDPNGAGYHIIQSKIAIGSGGIFGFGLKNGSQCQLDFLPEKYTDFIFSAIAEELGLFGCVCVLTLYMLLLSYNYSVVINTKDKFLKYLTFGINAMIFFYIFINIGMVCGIVPVVGVPLPFLSYGGTALSCLMVCEGLIVAINNAQKR